jgi:small subunit ribosomal protein S6
VREYELIYILHPDLTEQREGEIHAKLEEIVLRNNGIVLLRDDWGKRKLAYEIAKLQKGHYFVLSFLGQGSFIVELERELRLNPDVIRFLTVLANEKVKDPEARIAEAKTQAIEQQRRREQREREAAERRASDPRPDGARDDDDDDDDEDEVVVRERDRDRDRED